MDDLFEVFELGERRPKARIPYVHALELARLARRNLKPISEVVVITGSIRRKELEIGDVELVVLPKDLYKFLVLAKGRGFTGGERILRTVEDGLKVEVYLAHHPEELGGLVLWTTGDSIFNTALNARAKRMGYLRNQYGIWKDQEPVLQSPDEKEFFDFLGMEWHEPEQRSLATRSALDKVLRRLAQADVTRAEEEYVRAAREELRENKYLTLPDQERIRRLAKKRLKGRTQLGSEELIELGADRGPKEWSPRGVPDPIFPGTEWAIKQWRPPDVWGRSSAVWYGPGGPEGDDATEIEFQGDGWQVCEYHAVEGEIENPPEPFLQTCAFVDFEMLDRALARSGLRTSEDPNLQMLYAVDLGVALIRYRGGDEEWVDALP